MSGISGDRIGAASFPVSCGMGRPRRGYRRGACSLAALAAWLGVAACLAIGPALPLAVGQEAIEVQVVEGQLPADGVVEDEVVVEGVQNVRVARPFINDQQFDMWVFGNSGITGPSAGRNKLDTLLDLTVDEVVRLCGLPEIQRRRLILAGRGDIKRFLDLVEEKRKRFDKLKTDQNKLGEIYQETLPLQAMVSSGLFGEESLYGKTLKKVLETADATRYQEMAKEKELFRYRARVELVVAQLDQSLGLSDRQRRGLVDVILRETRPPTRYGQYAYYIVLYQASRIPREKLEPLFAEKQWAFFVRTLDSTRGMEQFLRQQGFLTGKDEQPEFAREFVRALREPTRRPANLPADVFADRDRAGEAAERERRTVKKD